MRPTADTHNLAVLAAAPNELEVPPRLLNRRVGKRFDRVRRFGRRLNVRRRRECFLCLDAAGAG